MVSPYPDPTAAPVPPAPGSTAEKMQHLFRFLDNSGWTVGDMLFALSSPPPGGGEHRKRLDDFLSDRERAGMGEEEAHGPETIMRLWIEGTPTAVSVAAAEAAHASTTPSASAPGTPLGATPGAGSDIAMSDSASLLELGTAVAFTGRIVISPTQADILGKWLMKPGRPVLAAEKQSIKPEHMRIYSSLAPLELHIRGAELCRVILVRDGHLKAEFADKVNALDALVEGPKLTPSNACDFASYSDYDLWHHSVMTFLQLSTRYPAFGRSQPAVLDIMPSTAPVPSLDTETPSFSHATHSHLDLHSHLLERALRVHWEDFRTALAERGGLLRSAVKTFSTHKKAATPIRLLAICDDVSSDSRSDWVQSCLSLERQERRRVSSGMRGRARRKTRQTTLQRRLDQTWPALTEISSHSSLVRCHSHRSPRSAARSPNPSVARTGSSPTTRSSRPPGTAGASGRSGATTRRRSGASRQSTFWRSRSCSRASWRG